MANPDETDNSREGAKTRSLDEEAISAIVVDCAYRLLTYLRLLGFPLGLLINFGNSTFKEGCKRIVNDHKNFAASRLHVNQNQNKALRHG